MNETITIDGIIYRADTPTDSQPWRIVIAQRGWVFVGRYHADGDDITLSDASVIRRWGTTNGLGELVNGPLVETVLDPAGVVRLHRLGVVAMVDVPGWPS